MEAIGPRGTYPRGLSRGRRTRPSGDGLRLLGHRHWNPGDPDLDAAQLGAVREVDCLPVVAAKRDIGRRVLAMDDAAELLSLWIEDIDAACSAAIDVAGDIHLHAIRDARFGTAQVSKYAVRLLGKRAVRQKIEGANVTAPRVIDVNHAFIR